MSTRYRHKAFTILELLIVISIILVLLGLAFIGYKHVTASGKLGATRTAMETCKSMLNEFTAANQKNGIATLNAIYNNAAEPLPNGRLDDPSSTLQYTDPSFINTQTVMGRLLAMGNNRSLMTKIPASRLLGKPPSPVSNLLPNNSSAPSPPLLLDGWGNPILFVPSQGLYGMTAGTTTYSQTGPFFLAPDHHPFFISAGPDGNFATGDDNIYSFEN